MQNTQKTKEICLSGGEARGAGDEPLSDDEEKEAPMMAGARGGER